MIGVHAVLMQWTVSQVTHQAHEQNVFCCGFVLNGLPPKPLPRFLVSKWTGKRSDRETQEQHACTRTAMFLRMEHFA